MRPVHRSVDLVGEAQQSGDAVIVVLAGEFDLAASGPVRDALTHAIREPRHRLTLDLRAVTFIDACGLQVILDAYKLCRETGRTLTIRPGAPNVQRVFELTNLADYLPFEAGE
jgi:anti-sigma B factor antagonist